MLFVTIHETGNSNKGANAKAHANYLKGNDAANAPVSWHYTVDDTETYQHLPETEDAFHAGDGGGNGNRQSIGIEICVNADGNFERAIDRAATLVADICTRRNIPVENIRQHFDWSKKNCPQNIRAGRPITWAVFLQKVQTAMDAKIAPPPNPHVPSEWAQDAWEWGIANRITDGTNPQNPATREQMMTMLHRYHRFIQ